MTFHDIIDAAHVQYDELKGTIALDEADARNLADEFEISTARWMPVGFTAAGGYEWGSMSLLLLDKHRYPTDTFDDLLRVAEDHDGHLPVVQVDVPIERVEDARQLDDATVWGVLARNFKRIHIVAFRGGLADRDMTAHRLGERVNLNDLGEYERNH